MGKATRLPAACRFKPSEVEVTKEGDQVALRRRGKGWAAFFDAESRGTLPPRHQPPLDDLDDIRSRLDWP